MAKIIPYTSSYFDPQIWVAHWGDLGFNSPRAWHQVWVGPIDDIYWIMAADGAQNFYAPEPERLAFALDLAAQPRIAARCCYACWSAELPMLYTGPRCLQWGMHFAEDQPRIPCIYWPHPYEWDNNPPGFYYPWQTPPP
jgi:hypothetical protein